MVNPFLAAEMPPTAEVLCITCGDFGYIVPPHLDSPDGIMAGVLFGSDITPCGCAAGRDFAEMRREWRTPRASAPEAA